MTGTSHRLRSDARAPRMLEIAALMTLAIAHPIADVLVRAPEFFIAHRFERTGLVTLGVLLFAGLPAVAWGVEWFMGRASSRAAQVFRWGLMGVLVALISFQAMKYLSVRAAIGLPVALVLAVGCCLAYARSSVARQFMAFLIPAPLVAAVVFFASAPVARLMQTSGIDVLPPDEAATRAPIVFVVFDQLPLVSLLDDTGDVDAGRYPHFAALAATSTWFRHAMAASDSTAWALPALLTGRVPDPDRLPTAIDTPGTLFSLFAATHDLHVEEPITTLCPPRLCPRPDEAGTAAARAVSVVNDLAIVYGHLALPRTLAAARLPQLTDDWRDFGPLLWHQRWVAHRDDDRRESARRWVEGLPAGAAPTLSFLHVLLPHEPYVYVPSGNLGAVHRDMPGLDANGRWSGDARLVSLSYQRQLLQVQFVDTLLGNIVGAMQRAGSFDATLLVVTADHGASFRPAMPFKAVEPATVADVGAVPLFIKLPGQHAGAEVHTLAQAVDVLPTIATALRRAVPWDVDGRDVLGSSAAGADRADDEACIFTERARRRLCVDRDTLHGSLLAAIRNRQWLAGTRTAATRVPEDIIGTAVADVAVVQSNQLRIHVDGEAAIANGADNFVPAYVSGILQRDDGPAAGSQVAIAVDGVVMATADVFDEEEAGRQGFWAALLPVDVMEEGAGEIAIFEIASVDPLELRTPDNGVSDASAPLNVVDPGVQVAHGVEVSGLHEFEWDGGVAFRWTNGAGRFVLPTRTVPAHAVLDVAVRMGGHPERQFTIRVNDCLVFDGRLPEGRWAESLPLDGCMGEDVTTVVVESDTFKPGAEDTRVLGVALESIVFSDGGGAGTAARDDR